MTTDTPAALDSMAAPAAAALAEPAPPIQIHTLGGFELLIDGTAPDCAGRQQRRPLDLLRTLLAYEPRGCSTQTLMAWLWPDLEGDAARNGLDLALHRLRRLLGHKGAVVLRDGQITLSVAHVWADVWELRRLCANSRALPAAQEVLRLYRGDFLPGHDESWIFASRERLRSQFLRVLTEAARQRLSDGQPAEAAQLYRRAIEYAPLSEDMHRGLIECLQRSDDTAAALAAFQKCREMLWRLQRIQPSPLTQALCQRLQTC